MKQIGARQSRTHQVSALADEIVLFKLDDEFRIGSHRSRPLSGYLQEPPKLAGQCAAEMLHQL